MKNVYKLAIDGRFIDCAIHKGVYYLLSDYKGYKKNQMFLGYLSKLGEKSGKTIKRTIYATQWLPGLICFDCG